MKLSDYIVSFFKERGVEHFFGYQGTMIAHVVDSIGKADGVQNHCCYNEQGAAFAACGAAKATGNCAVAYATSGPGAMNLLSGVADAFYDSAPIVFLTGQVNTNEYTAYSEIRQQAFQEADVVAMATGVTKYCTQIQKPESIRYELEKAYFFATSGRPGPVLLDIPMNIQRAEIEPEQLTSYAVETPVLEGFDQAIEQVVHGLSLAKRPLLILGNGLDKHPQKRAQLVQAIDTLGIPVVTSMLGRDLLPTAHPLNYGFLGAAYGHRTANLLACRKADYILALGCSLCKRQTGMGTEEFAAQAQIVRVDIDAAELTRRVHKDDVCFLQDANAVLLAVSAQSKAAGSLSQWVEACNDCRAELTAFDAVSEGREPNRLVEQLSAEMPPQRTICCDVGQHQLWTAQSFVVKEGQRLLFSGGHGAMGFSLPAAIGAYYATGKPVYCICGDGSFQMNIQELQWVAREQVPVGILVLNNQTLGLIQQQQDDFFNGQHHGATEEFGFTSPHFAEVAKAYGIAAEATTEDKAVAAFKTMDHRKPFLLEVCLSTTTKALPKTYFGEAMYQQKPYVSQELMDKLIAL